MSSIARAPVEKRGNRRIDALRGSGGDTRLVAMLLGEMDEEMLRLERAPAKARISPSQLVPLRSCTSKPKKKQREKNRNPQIHWRVIAACERWPPGVRYAASPSSAALLFDGDTLQSPAWRTCCERAIADARDAGRRR